MTQEHKETNGTRIGFLNKENLEIDREHLIPSRRTHKNDFGNDRGRRMKQLIAIDGSDRAAVDELTPSRDDRLIIDQRSRFDFIM